MPTPSTSRHYRQTSPPLSVSSQAFTIGQQQKPNVVTRLAIEGKAKQGQDGASIRVYLKISLPLESVSPGVTIALFPEENVKILTSQVHPIDANSVPYNFSSTTSPLLHNAARALNLPTRSSISYMSLFGLSHTTSSSIGSSSRATASNGVNPPTLDEKYTGHILVSGYNVSYVLPKEFPRFKGTSQMDDEGSSVVHGTPMTASRGRRSSVGDKNFMQFMAAIDMWVPYLSRPPRAPYLLSIPTPRCLSNHVKLRIFPPTPTAASFASLSSAEDDGGTWDLTSDPHVTRGITSRLGRANSHSHFADDESSDSSTTGFSDGCGIQGTFPSAERLRVRWAAPLKNINVPNGDGRRRVGVKEAMAEMTCLVLGKGKARSNDPEGIVMGVEYKGTCKGVWFPGVATMLGMDIGLEAKGSDVSWFSESEPKWTVEGGLGYTGFDTGVPSQERSDHTTDSRSQIYLLPSTPSPPAFLSRQNSSSSTSSLLRAPLPAQNVPEYSFEGSVASLAPSGTISSIGSVPPSDPNIDRRDSASINGPLPNAQDRPPGAPITIHIDMNDLLPPSKKTLTFTISGTILVTPRPRPHTHHSRTSSPAHSENETDPEPIVLPRFTVLAADAETTAFHIRNEATRSTVEVYNSSGDIRDAQTRKTVLQKGGFTRCGSDGARIALRSLRPLFGYHDQVLDGITDNGRQPQPQPRTTTHAPSSPSPKKASSPKSRRSGRLVIPFVEATVTPLLSGRSTTLSGAYAVRLCLPAPCDVDSEWLDLMFAAPVPGTSADSPTSTTAGRTGGFPRLHIASASVDGVPILIESGSDTKREQTSGLAVAEPPSKDNRTEEKVSWVKVHVAGRGGENVVIDYVVKSNRRQDVRQDSTWKLKGKDDDGVYLDVLLPSFTLPVGRLEVKIDTAPEICISSLQSNFTHQQSRRLLQYSMEEPFHPRLSLFLHPSSHPHGVYSLSNVISKTLGTVVKTAPAILSLVVLFYLISLSAEVREVRQSVEACSTLETPISASLPWGDDGPAPTVTVTRTVQAPSRSRWWFGDFTVNLPSPATSATHAYTIDGWPPNPSSDAQDAQSRVFLSVPAQTGSTESPSGEQGILTLTTDLWPPPWPPTLNFPPSARKAADSLVEGLSIVWQILRKAYHYPLDPPP